MQTIFFDSWETLFRIVISSIVVYLCIVIFLKVSGKRSTSQLNNFDWIVTVMLGSIGASTVILKGVPIIEGMASIVTLLTLQFLVTKYSAISPEFSQVLLSEPQVVFYRGQFLPEAMQKERLTHQELECAMRSEGINNFSEIEAIIFESDAKLTVIPIAKDDKIFDTDGNPTVSDTLKNLI